MPKITLDHILVGCAVVVTALVAHKYLTQDSRPSAAAAAAAVEVSAEDWQEIVAVGHGDGNDGAIMTVATFLDFECPFCRHSELDVLGPFHAANPDDVKIVRLHYPLPGHPYALPAAHAAECASAQGRFTAYSTELFRLQGKLASSPFVEAATAVELPDMVAFERCLDASGSSDLIDRHTELGQRIGVSGTPTVVVNGKMYPGGGPTALQFDSLLADLRATAAGDRE